MVHLCMLVRLSTATVTVFAARTEVAVRLDVHALGFTQPDRFLVYSRFLLPGFAEARAYDDDGIRTRERY